MCVGGLVLKSSKGKLSQNGRPTLMGDKQPSLQGSEGVPYQKTDFAVFILVAIRPVRQIVWCAQLVFMFPCKANLL